MGDDVGHVDLIHVFDELLHVSLVADGLTEEELLDGERRYRAQAGEQLEQLGEPMWLGRVLFVDVGVEEDLRLILKIGDAV